MDSTAAPAPTLPLRLLDYDAASDHIMRNKHFLRRMVLERKVSFYKIGGAIRFDPADLNAFVMAGRVEAQSPRPADPGEAPDRRLGAASTATTILTPSRPPPTTAPRSQQRRPVGPAAP